MRLAAILLVLALSGCAIPVTRTGSFIVVDGDPSQPRCAAVAGAVGKIASSASYAALPLPPQPNSRTRVIASYRRADQQIILYDWDGSCVVYASDLQDTLHALRSRRLDARIEQKTYASTFELIPYAP